MPIRVFKTPTRNNTTQIHVGISEDIQVNTNITSISLTQVENLPEPSTLADLTTEPLTISNAPINASKSVQKSTLAPGFSLQAVPIGDISVGIPQIEIEEVVIPEGYIHLDDISDWTKYNYNRSFFDTDANFKPLPGESNIPIKCEYDVIIRGRKFRAVYSDPVDNIKVYYRRVKETSEDFEWVFWKSLIQFNNNLQSLSLDYEFPYDGQFVFRAVPCIQETPIGGYTEYEVLYEEDDSLQWSAIQISEDSFIVRMEGHLGKQINYLEIREHGKVLTQRKLISDKNGFVVETIRVNGVSNDKSPQLEYRFFRKKNAFKSYITHYYNTIDRNYAIEPISFVVRQMVGAKFSVQIKDTDNLLYSPVSEIDAFTGSSFNRAIQEGKLICKLQINRHQDGEVVPYGEYVVNVTQEKNTKFLNRPPFGEEVKKISQGFEFVFEDTQEFRQISQISNPDFSKAVLYEFRLLFWSAGVESGLITGDRYAFVKEKAITVKNKKRQYKFSYDTWSEEHPRKKYTGVIPVDVQYAFLQDHIKYGSSPKGFVIEAEPDPIERTRDITLSNAEWKVLYYYNDKDDEIQEFPYACFQIGVPGSSMLEIEKLDLYVSAKKGKDNEKHLGTYHPSETIDIIDFQGYYEAMKNVTSKVDYGKTLGKLGASIDPRPSGFGIQRSQQPLASNFSPRAQRQIGTATRSAVQARPESSSQTFGMSMQTMSRPNQQLGISQTMSSGFGDLPTMSTNTMASRLESRVSNRSINKTISAKAETGVLTYRVDITYRDQKTASIKMSVPLSTRPKIPDDPEGNSSIAIGNKTFSDSTIQLPINVADTLNQEIAQIAIPTSTTLAVNITSSTVETAAAAVNSLGSIGSVGSFGGYNR